jgi:hypothetical protein
MGGRVHRHDVGWLRLLGLLSCIALAISGCSGSGGDAASDRTAASAQTAGAFAVSLQQANAEGAQRAQEISRLSASAKGQGLERTLEIYAAIAEQARAGRDRYAALRVPPAVSAEMADILRLLTDQVEALDSLAPVARAGDQDRTAQLISRLSQLTSDLQVARQRLDAALIRCGKDCA